MLQDDVQEADGNGGDLYRTIATNCLRYFNLKIEEIDRLTLPEYDLLMEAYNLREIDRADERHQQAWLGVVAGATKKDGKPVYKKYPSFFDKDAEEEKLREKTKKKKGKFDALSRHLKDKQNGSK